MQGEKLQSLCKSRVPATCLDYFHAVIYSQPRTWEIKEDRVDRFFLKSALDEETILVCVPVGYPTLTASYKTLVACISSNSLRACSALSLLYSNEKSSPLPPSAFISEKVRLPDPVPGHAFLPLSTILMPGRTCRLAITKAMSIE